MARPRKPCRTCGGEKPPGRRHWTCGSCPPSVLLPQETQDEIVRLYTEEGLSHVQIGKRLFCGSDTVRRTLLLRGVPMRPSGGAGQAGRLRLLTHDDIDAVVELYMGGMSIRQVADQMNMSFGGVRRRLVFAGVSLRGKGEGRSVYRRARIASTGGMALTPPQLKALRLLESDPDRWFSTREVKAEVGGHPKYPPRVLRDLEALGLVARNPKRLGPNRSRLWRRTDLPAMDVLAASLTPTFSGKPSADDALPIGPFRDWLERWIDEEERKLKHMAVARWAEGSDGTGGLPSVGVVCRALEITERRLYAFRHDQHEIAFQTADRLLKNSGRPETIEDLWPHLALEDAA